MINFKRHPCRRALISVADKTGIVEFARQLLEMGIELLSTGGTATFLSDHGISITQVSDYTGFPEIMDGRVKTLHPKIHGGILGRRDQDKEAMCRHDIGAIDLVIVNLYPFAATIANPDNSLQNAIENIDIGGVTLLRAAAKNYAHVVVVASPADYNATIEGLKDGNGWLNQERRFELAVKAFEHTAQYDRTIAGYLRERLQEDNIDFPRELTPSFQRVQVLRYGENPHQRGAFYIEKDLAGSGIATAKTIHGKQLSYNNIADADVALECVRQFSSPACVIVKHTNPCGVAMGETVLQAYERAWEADPTSAFGGIIAINRELDPDAAKAITERQFVEVLIAPVISMLAREVLALKKNLRVLECNAQQEMKGLFDYKSVAGGLLVQDMDISTIEKDDVKFVTKRTPSDDELEDLLFAWKVVKFVKSNAIVYARNHQTIGIGAGQMSRVYSAKIAAMKAQDEKLKLDGAVMASDAFFPFRDALDAAHEHGVTAVIQPGGSKNDDEIIAVANEMNISMIFMGIRHFRH